MDFLCFAATAAIVSVAMLWQRKGERTKAVSIPQPPIRTIPHHGKVVLVTGASSGIGRAIALRFAKEGARLALHYGDNVAGIFKTAELAKASGGSECIIHLEHRRVASRIASTHALICNRKGRSPDRIPLTTFAGATDVRVYQASLDEVSGTALCDMITSVLADFGIIHVFVNNAGRFIEHKVDSMTSTFSDFRSDWHSSMNINLNSAALLGYLVGRHMISRSPLGFLSDKGSDNIVAEAPVTREKAIGAIVFVGSRGAYRGEPFSWMYGASKAGLHALAQNMARSLGKFGVVVNAVAPGFVATEQKTAMLEGPAGEAITTQSPMHRVASMEEVAEAVFFLAQYEINPWSTGAVLDCNGASYLR